MPQSNFLMPLSMLDDSLGGKEGFLEHRPFLWESKFILRSLWMRVIMVSGVTWCYRQHPLPHRARCLHPLCPNAALPPWRFIRPGSPIPIGKKTEPSPVVVPEVPTQHEIDCNMNLKDGGILSESKSFLCSPQDNTGAPLHCARTARYFLDQVPPEESPSTPLPNTLISPLPQEHVALPP